VPDNGESVELLVARRTNNWKVVGSRPDCLIEQGLISPPTQYRLYG